MRANLIVGLVVVIVVAVVAVQFDTIESWFSDNEATTSTAIGSPPAPSAQSDSNATTAAEKPDKSAQPEKAVEQTATAEATPQPEPAAKRNETEPDKSAQPEKAVEQTATAEATPQPEPAAKRNETEPDKSAQPEKAVEQTATAEATPQPEPAAKRNETEPDKSAQPEKAVEQTATAEATPQPEPAAKRNETEPDKSAQPEKAVEQTATAEATPQPEPAAKRNETEPDKSAQPEKAVEQTATAEATPQPEPAAKRNETEPDKSAQPEKAVEQTATAEATPQPEPAAKRNETEPDDAAKDSDNGVKPPSFDVVRVNPKGDAVIAGRAEPGAEVTVKDADEVLGKVTADKRGEWVLVPEKPLSSGARQLSLQEKTTGGDEKSSKNVVVLFVPEKKQSGESNKSEAIVVLMPREGQGASRVLQELAPSKSDDSAAKSDKDLSLKVIDYDEEGRVILSGKAPPGSEVRALVDEKTVGTAQADKSGDWQISPSKPVVSGQHAIRIEQVSKSGIVLAKLNVPFSRAIVRTGSLAPGTVVVEAGNSLWRIARATYREGTKYTLIFAANNEQIGNPNVIFPGQIFVLPPDTTSN